MNNRFIALSLIIVGIAFSRLLPHPPNFSPVAAMALFGGVYFTDKKWSFIIPVAAMLLSDLLLGFHRTLPFVYVSFVLITLLGIWQQRNIRKPLTLPLLAISSSLLFFFLTNMGVWATYSFYPHTLEGLQMSLAAGLPFLRNTIAGDFAYIAVMFGTWAVLQNRVPALRLSNGISA